jgi:hypothetical protein
MKMPLNPLKGTFIAAPFGLPAGWQGGAGGSDFVEHFCDLESSGNSF